MNRLKKHKSPEQDIKNTILEWLGYRNAFVWPNDSVGIFDPVKKVYRRKISRFHRNGVSDILGIWKGKPLAIEVKSKTGRVSPEQVVFLDLFNRFGGIGFVARSLDDVIEQLKEPKTLL